MSEGRWAHIRARNGYVYFVGDEPEPEEAIRLSTGKVRDIFINPADHRGTRQGWNWVGMAGKLDEAMRTAVAELEAAEDELRRKVGAPKPEDRAPCGVLGVPEAMMKHPAWKAGCWNTARGERVPVELMTDQHIAASIRMVVRAIRRNLVDRGSQEMVGVKLTLMERARWISSDDRTLLAKFSKPGSMLVAEWDRRFHAWFNWHVGWDYMEDHNGKVPVRALKVRGPRPTERAAEFKVLFPVPKFGPPRLGLTGKPL